MKAQIVLKDGEMIETTAKKSDGHWLIGGDYLNAWTDLGAKVFIIKDKKIYFLKGAAMIFQDYVSEEGA